MLSKCPNQKRKFECGFCQIAFDNTDPKILFWKRKTNLIRARKQFVLIEGKAEIKRKKMKSEYLYFNSSSDIPKKTGKVMCVCVFCFLL